MSVILIDRSLIFLVKTLVITFTYRISSNNGRGRLFPFWHQKGAIIRRRRLIEGRLLFRGNTVYLRAIIFKLLFLSIVTTSEPLMFKILKYGPVSCSCTFL